MGRVYRVVWLCCLMVLMWGSARAASPEDPKIGSVRFEGNEAFTEERLYRLMFSRPSRFLRSSRYRPEVLKSDLRNLELFYRQSGYLEAQITDHGVEADTVRGEVQIRIQVSEGELTRLEGVGVFRNRVLSDEELLAKADMRSGDPFERKKMEDALAAMLMLYADNGYVDAEVTPEVRINTETHRALIDFSVRERVQCSIGEIRLVGLEKTRPYVARRELRFRPGDVVKYSRLLESQRQLYMTGLFQSVFVRPELVAGADSTRRDVLVELKENLAGEFSASVGYESLEKFRGKLEVSNSNLRGTARKLGLITRISFINRGVEVSFTEPWTLGTRWRTDVNGMVDYEEEPGYDQNRIGGRVTFGRSFLRRSTAMITYRQEKVKLSHIRVTPAPEDTRTHIRSLRLSLLYDTRDNLFDSRKGTYGEWSNEIVGSFLGGTNSFVRSLLRVKRFHTLNPATILGTSLEVGWMDASGGLEEIPLNERFYAGGPNSLRAFEDQRAGPLDENRLPLGGRVKIVWNMLEVRRAIYKIVGGVFFVDVGNVWSASEQVDLRDLRTSVGIGLRVNTPVGLARLDYGVNADPQEGEPGGKVYFSMGQVF